MITVKKKKEIKKKNGVCVYCGCNNSLALTIDHKTPTTRGGTDEDENLQTCCWMCNQLKGPLTHIEFKKYLKALTILFELHKIKICFPGKLDLSFNQNHHPDYQYKPDLYKKDLIEEKEVKDESSTN